MFEGGWGAELMRMWWRINYDYCECALVGLCGLAGLFPYGLTLDYDLPSLYLNADSQ